MLGSREEQGCSLLSEQVFNALRELAEELVTIAAQG